MGTSKRKGKPGGRSAAEQRELDEALLEAVSANDLRALRRALAAGANVEATDEDEQTPLMIAAHETGPRTKTIDLLLEAGADPRAKDESGFGALRYAVVEGFVAIVKRLLAAGVEPDDLDEAGQSALHDAAKHDHASVVRCLLDAGCAIDRTDVLGRTPLYLASGGGGHEGAALLVARGASVGTADAEGVTPLMRACTVGKRAVVEMLLENGADPTLRANDGRTAADLAVSIRPADDPRAVELVALLHAARGRR